MSSIAVRPFRRSDRDQLTALLNAHAAAVIPGVSVSVTTVLSYLEREPDEVIVDPWVIERTTLVAEQNGLIVAAAHLLRFSDDAGVSDSYRNAGDIRWLVSKPPAPYWPDSAAAADLLVAACVEKLEQWGVSRRTADGALPVLGVYGVPDQWPHVREAYTRAGFVQAGPTEIVYLATIDALPVPAAAPFSGLALERTVGSEGTRLTATYDGDFVGYVEVATYAERVRNPRAAGWADLGNLHVVEGHRRRGVATWLVAHAGEWLRLARADRVLAYATPDEREGIAFLGSVGFRELTRTRRGWVREPARLRLSVPESSSEL